MSAVKALVASPFAVGSSTLDGIAERAALCLLRELETWPKPGLVSHVDSGSHDDMDAATFRASAAAIIPYLRDLTLAGTRGYGMGSLRVIGIEAEVAMLAATGGINTHRGAIFGMGLLCAAAGARAAGRAGPDEPLGHVVAKHWGREIVDGPVPLLSHGTGVRRRYGAGGARMEAASGFPSIYEVGLPALRAARRKRPRDAEAARVETCMALIAEVQDTNLLHRGGAAGLRLAQDAARQFLAHGGIADPAWLAHAELIHREFMARRLSPGGSADLLAMTLFVEAEERRP